MRKNLQIIIQVIFLGLFIFLLVKGKAQLWMALFLLGIIASFLLGRIYCGWICSINTSMKGVTWIKKKLKIKNLKIPYSLTKPWVRTFALALFITVFIFIMITGKSLPVLPFLFSLGILITFFYPEELWHRYLCPYGSIIRLPALKSAHHMVIDAEKCINCGACTRVCPAKAIVRHESHHEILKEDCLVCFDCSDACKKDAIKYK